MDDLAEGVLHVPRLLDLVIRPFPVETKHRLENPEQDTLHIIEVQNGPYLGEDDIVRFKDDYGRTAGR